MRKENEGNKNSKIVATRGRRNEEMRYNWPVGILRRISSWIGTDREMTNIVAGNTAPNFSLKSLDGKEYSLHALLQKGPVVAAFFKISCPVCQFTFPFLERLFKKYGGDGVTFLAISQDDASATKRFLAEYGVTFPTVLDEKGYPVSNAYALTTVPTILLIETDGTVKVSAMGFDRKELETVGKELSERQKIPAAALFLPNERIPDYKPG
jgi:peroxiredoxin